MGFLGSALDQRAQYPRDQGIGFFLSTVFLLAVKVGGIHSKE